MIKFDNVTKKFGLVTALDKVNFEISDKEFVFIIGPSGAGKTTIIKLILRDYLPTSGKIKINEHNLNQIAKRELVNLRRNIGVVFQDYRLLLDRTVYENVALSLKVLGEKEEKIKTVVDEVLKMVGLAARSEFFPAQLAGGELQRVCLARAVVGKPEVVIADEPTGNVDPTTAWQIVKLLKKINELGKTVIMTTHNFEIVNSLKERVIELDKGKLISDKKKGQYQVR